MCREENRKYLYGRGFHLRFVQTVAHGHRCYPYAPSNDFRSREGISEKSTKEHPRSDRSLSHAVVSDEFTDRTRAFFSFGSRHPTVDNNRYSYSGAMSRRKAAVTITRARSSITHSLPLDACGRSINHRERDKKK